MLQLLEKQQRYGLSLILFAMMFTASRDIADLLDKGCIKKVEGTTGRGTRYTINHK